MPGCKKSYAWVVVLSGTLILILKSGSYIILGVILLDLQDYLNASKSHMVMIAAVLDFLTGTAGLLQGPVVARYGCRPVGIVNSVIASLAYFLTMFCTEVWQACLCYGVLLGVSMAACNPIVFTATSQWFQKKQSSAVALVMAGLGLGVFIWSPFVTWLVTIYTWKGALLITCGLQLNGILLFGLLRSAPGSHEAAVSSKDDVNSSIPEVSNVKSVSLQNPKTQTEAERMEYSSTSQSEGWFSWMAIMKDKYFIVFLGSEFLIGMGYTLPFTYTISRAVMLGHSREKAALLSSMQGISAVISRVILGVVSNWFDARKRALLSGLSACVIGACAVATQLVDNYWLLAIYSLIFGSFGSVHVVFMVSILTDLFGTKYISERFGVESAVTGTSYFIGNIVAGVIWDYTHQPSLPFAVLGALQMFASLGNIFLYRKLRILNTK